MNDLIQYLASHDWRLAIIVGIPLVFQAAKWLRPWLDLTRLPPWAQLVLSHLTVSLPVLALRLQTLPWPDAVWSALDAGFASLGVYHGAKSVFATWQNRKKQ